MDSLLFLRAFVSLCVTLGLIVLLGWAWKRYGQPFSHKMGLSETAPARRLNVIESRRLNPTTTLYLVNEGDAEHLIATTAAQTTLISTRKLAKPAKLKS
ncbi:MAG: hypothetical protein DI585_06860 [Pseudomonas fluorescens]|nr:MAG: hypothetical protein DI585_06860 [Pseudomonas fluorescens]